MLAGGSRVTETPSTPPADDHTLAAWLAEEAGRRLLQVREEASPEASSRTPATGPPTSCSCGCWPSTGPTTPCFGGGEGRPRPARRRPGLDVDPLDGTREFSEPPRDDWAVHVALWERAAGDGTTGEGDLTAGAVAQPALGETFHTGAPPAVPARTAERLRLAVSRSRPPEFTHGLASSSTPSWCRWDRRRQGDVGGPRRRRRLRARRGPVRVGLRRPVAVARAAGRFSIRVDGWPMTYNQSDVYLPDLVVCRPESPTGSSAGCAPTTSDDQGCGMSAVRWTLSEGLGEK